MDGAFEVDVELARVDVELALVVAVVLALGDVGELVGGVVPVVEGSVALVVVAGLAGICGRGPLGPLGQASQATSASVAAATPLVAGSAQSRNRHPAPGEAGALPAAVADRTSASRSLGVIEVASW